MVDRTTLARLARLVAAEVAAGQPGPNSLAASRFLEAHATADKINIAALGNVVPQLHVHVIARRSSDVAWPRPVWGATPPLAHDPEELKHFIRALRRKIWLES